jgi:hypothetical protein
MPGQAVGGKQGRTAVSVLDPLPRDGCVRLTLATRKSFLVLFFTGVRLKIE